ncbi:S8 family peptidase [Microbulbifer thermotolerans]|nr:S8 family peptidase [Microbulbifer thermotolerans]
MKSPLKNLVQKSALLSAVTLLCAGPFTAHAVETSNPAAAPMSMSAQPVTDRIIVKYKNTSQLSMASSMSQTAMENASRLAGTELRHMRRLATGAQLMRLNKHKGGAELAEIISRLQQDPNVEYAEPDLLLQPMAIPNDTYYNQQWHYFESAAGLNLPSAWDTTQGEGVVVAVIDTGYRPHADLVDNILPGYDMISDSTVAQDGGGRDSDPSDPGDWAPANACYSGSPATNSSWHGTHVAGTIAAVTNNGTGVAGVAYKAKVVPIRVLGRCGGYTSDIADAIIWGAGGSVSGVPSNPNPAQVLNLSLGGSGSCGTTTQNAINTARSLGATVVVAAGNSGANAGNYTPASCSGVITVASVDRSGGRAWYSNYGSVVDVAAPGGDTSVSSNGVLSTLNSGTQSPGSDNYAYYQGTSMAAPHVAGAAALLYSVDPTITPSEVESILTSTARSFPASCSQCGAGIVDAAAAVAAAGGGNNGGGGGEETGWTETNLSGSQGSWQHFTLEVNSGMSSLNVEMSGGSGDADLYVRYGAQPTTSNYDCRPYRWGNSESCSFNNPSAGTWYISIRGYNSYSGVTLDAQATE